MDLLRHWFLAAVGAAILIAWLVPGPGAALPWLSGALVPVIFLAAGLGLPARELRRAVRDLRLHAAIQGTSFLLLPPLFVAAAWLLQTALAAPAALALGLIVLGCLPATITSCVVFTRQSAGDEAGAVVNAALGNLLAIGLTPGLVALWSGRHGEIDAVGTALSLIWQVAVPFAVGQLLRVRLGPWADRRRTLLGALANAVLVALIWEVFSAGFARGLAVGGGVLAALAGLILGLHAAALAVPWLVGRWLGLGRPQRVTVVVCASQKTAALGIPMIPLLLPGDPALALVTVPLLLYHPLQLATASLLAPLWVRWARAPDPQPG
jgi:sodium/bile acid cotransporter 7